MWFARIAAFFGGSFFKGLAKWLLIPMAIIAGSYFGVSKIIKTIVQSNNYESVQVELNDANEALDQKDKDYADKIASLEADRIKEHEHHVEFEREAIRENSKLKEALKRNEKNKKWHDSGIPIDLVRLLCEQTRACSDEILTKLEDSRNSE